ncbi:hypothetical protein Hanom_Chr06g00568161 [Helianthus anomalus]
MKVKTGSEPVPGTPNVSTELVLRIFWFSKFGTSTHYYLLISDYGFLPNKPYILKTTWNEQCI